MRDGHARERPAAPGGERRDLLRAAAASACVARHGNERVQRGLARLDAVEVQLRELDARKFLARSPAASSATVLVCRLTCDLLDDLRHEIQTGFNLRRIRLVALVRVLLRDLIRAQALREARQRVRHRLDTLRLGTIQLAHEVENARQALLIDRNLGLVELEAREMRDVRDLLACQGHE